MDFQLIEKNKDILRSQIFATCENENRTTSAYSNFLTTIAVLSAGLSPLIPGDKNIGSSLKAVFILSLVSVFLSLVFGVVYAIYEKRFFAKWTANYSKLFHAWNNIKKEEDIENAIKIENDIYSKNKIESPYWPVVFQTAFIFIGLMGLIIIIAIKI